MPILIRSAKIFLSVENTGRLGSKGDVRFITFLFFFFFKENVCLSVCLWAAGSSSLTNVAQDGILKNKIKPSLLKKKKHHIYHDPIMMKV